MNLHEVAEQCGIVNPRRVAWILFHSREDELNDKHVLGLILYDFLEHMGFPEARASFITITVLDWAHKEIQEKRPAVIDLIDQRFLLYFGTYEDGYNAWDFIDMKQAGHNDLPKKPLISIAISLAELYKKKTEQLIDKAAVSG